MAPVAFSIFANAPTVSDISNSPVILGPNITGTFAELYGLGSAISTGALSGAFAKGSITTWLNSGLENNNKAIDFMANLSDSTFGASETIQPQSGYSLIIIKE